MAAALVTGIVIAGFLAITLVHGTLQPFLEARGVRPWTLLDTIASIPLVITGAAGVGAVGAVALQLVQLSPRHGVGTAIVALAAGFSVSLLLIWLGLRALRKLT